MTKESSLVQEVRERAMQIEERFENDLHKYYEHLRNQEKKHPEKIVDQIAVVRSDAVRNFVK